MSNLEISPIFRGRKKRGIGRIWVGWAVRSDFRVVNGVLGPLSFMPSCPRARSGLRSAFIRLFGSRPLQGLGLVTSFLRIRRIPCLINYDITRPSPANQPYKQGLDIAATITLLHSLLRLNSIRPNMCPAPTRFPALQLDTTSLHPGLLYLFRSSGQLSAATLRNNTTRHENGRVGMVACCAAYVYFGRKEGPSESLTPP